MTICTSCTCDSRMPADVISTNSARGAELVDRRATAIAHRRAQAAHQLVDDRRQRALVRNAAFDALRHEPLRRALAFGILEIAVGASLLHRAERTHAAIALVRAALVELRFAGRLLGAGEEAAEHHRRRARGQRLRDIARVADAAVGDHRNAGARDALERELDRRDLRHADAGDDARRADRPRADADFHRVRAMVGERLRAVRRRDIAADDLYVADAPA